MDVTILCAFPCNASGAFFWVAIIGPDNNFDHAKMIIKTSLESGYQRYFPSFHLTIVCCKSVKKSLFDVAPW
jgi:hypothetical protein